MSRYDQPEEVSSGDFDKFTFGDHIGALVCIRPLSEGEVTYPVRAGEEDKPDAGKPKAVVYADIDLIEGGYMPKSKEAEGEQFSNVTISNVVLVRSLALSIGKEVLGRIGLGEKGKSAQPPIVLQSHTDDDVAKADAFYAKVTAAPAKAPKKAATKKAAVKSPTEDDELTDEQKAAIAAILGKG